MKKNGKWREGSPPPGAGEGAWGSGLRNLTEQAPDEAGEFPSQSDHDFGFDDSALQKKPGALVESDLGLPGELTVRGGLALLAQGELGGDLGRAQGVLGGLDQDPAGVGVAVLGDLAELAGLTGGMFTRNQPEEGHQVAGVFKSSQIAQFGNEHRGRSQLETSHAHKSLNHGVP